MKYVFIRAHQAEFGVRAMCRVLQVHFSGFYAWLKEPLSRRAQDDVRQTELIRRAWSDSGSIFRKSCRFASTFCTSSATTTR